MALAGPNRKPALVAAASKISYSRSAASKLKEAPWQTRAWAVYDKLPAVFYMTRYRSDIASKIEYFVGTIDEPGQDPALDENGAGFKVLEAEGGPDLLRRIVSEMVVHWDVPGEGYLCRFEEDPLWRVLSTQELKKQGEGYFWGDDRTNLGQIDSDNVYRVWDPHPRLHWEADSPTRHIIEDAEELILLSREAKARSLSRISAGAWILSSGVDFTPFGADGEGDLDDFAAELTRVMSLAVEDTGSAASLVPWILTMDPQDAEIAIKGHVKFDREWDINLELRRELLRSVATGLDLPPEILTGVADLNHWSAWLVSEMAVSQHVLPTVDAILDSLTINWFRPLLEASGVDPDGYVLWRDPSPATVPPDQSDVALKLFELGGISGEAVRRVTNFDEDDAPSPEELERLKPAQETPPVDGPPEGVRASIDPDFLSQIVEEVTRRLKEGDPPLGEAAVTAAVARRVDAKPLADIDRELLAWLVEETQREIDRLLGVVEKTLTAATDPLNESLLSRFRSRVDEKIAEAQAAARQWVENLTGQPTQFEDEEQTRGIGLDLIIGGVIEAIRRRLFTPKATPDPIDLGQLPDTLPPIDVLRRGLSVAGGGESRFDDVEVVDGIGNGQRIHDELEANGFRPELFRWVTGAPSHPFDPHERLDGTEFDSWDSPKLAVTLDGQWISGSHYRPNDHKGCQCSVEQQLVEFSSAMPGEAVTPEWVELPKYVNPRIDRHTLNVDKALEMSAEQLATVQEAFRRMDARFPGMLDEVQEIRVSGDITAFATKDRWSVMFNRDYINKVGSVREEWASLRTTVPAQIATKGGGAINDVSYLHNVTLHELSHVGEHRFRAVASQSQIDDLRGLFTQMQKDHGINTTLENPFETLPSLYADENYGEFVAEALSDALINDSPNVTSLRVLDLFSEVFK